MSRILGAVLLTSVLAGCGGNLDITGAEDPAVTLAADIKALRPTGNKLGTLANTDNDWRLRANHFSNHGGPMMMGPTSVYYIWYGSWTDTAAQAVLTDLAQNLGGSPYFGIVGSYKNAAGVAPANALIYSGAITDDYSMGANLSASDVQMIVSQALASGQLPTDPDAVYVVLLSVDVDVTTGLCSTFCGYHGTTNANSTTVKYALIGNTARCPTACSPQTIGPNGSSAGDAMASLVAAELFNSVTDPELTAWFDRGGYEGADKCAWTYGTSFTTANGAKANVTLGGRDYYLQQLWIASSAVGNGKKADTCALAQ